MTKSKSIKLKSQAGVKVPVKKSTKAKAKPAKGHVKSFYRPRTAQINVLRTDVRADSKLDSAIWVPVALVLAITSMALNLMLIMVFNNRY